MMLLLLTGACIAITCFAAGVTAGPYLHRQRAAPAPPEAVKPVCGCTHHYAFHDAETGECRPVPLPEYYAPEITDGEGG